MAFWLTNFILQHHFYVFFVVSVAYYNNLFILVQFLTLLKEGAEVHASERTDKEAALTKTVDTMVLSEESADVPSVDRSETYEYETKCREKFSNTETKIASEVSEKHYQAPKRTTSEVSTEVKAPIKSRSLEVPVEEGRRISYEKKITVLYALLSACVADNSETGNKCSQVRNGYDARHRVALRLLATWLGVEWLKVVCLYKQFFFFASFLLFISCYLLL